MPWNKGISDSQPARYEVPVIAGACTWSVENIDMAGNERKKAGQHRESLLVFQKECEKKKDFQGARFFRDEAAETMKRYRGWDICVRWIEGDRKVCHWRFPVASEQISPYIDAAFDMLLYGNRELFAFKPKEL